MNRKPADIQHDLLIIWHSRTGAAKQLALAAYRRIDTANAISPAPDSPRVRMARCEVVEPGDLLGARAYLFACPENLASMSGEMKAFFDRCYYPVLGCIEGRAYASIVSAGSDGHGAAAQIARIATGWRLRACAEPLIVGMQAQTPAEILAPKRVPDAFLEQAADLGQGLAEAAAMGVY